MFIFAGIAAMVWWEIVLIVLIGGLLIVGTHWDRTSRGSSAMWSAVFVVIVATTLYMGFTPALDMVMSSAFWKNVALYLGIGLVYSWVVEFLFGLRRARKHYRECWERAVREDKKLKNYLSNPEDCTTEVKDGAKDAISYFHKHYDSKSRLIGIDLAENNLSVTPRVNRAVLVNSVAAWSMLWPAYAVSLIVGDLFNQVIEFIVDISSKLSTMAVRFTFQNTFKL